jgi:hypothetical protein
VFCWVAEPLPEKQGLEAVSLSDSGTMQQCSCPYSTARPGADQGPGARRGTRGWVGLSNLGSAGTRDGVRIVGLGNANTLDAAGTNKNVLAGNLIGTKANGTEERGNLRYGVRIEGKASRNVIGYDGDPNRDDAAKAAARNIIAFNGSSLALKGHGVSIDSGERNRISRNSFFKNYGRAIDLNDATENATFGAEFHINQNGSLNTGANLSRDYPVLTDIVFGAANRTMTWSLDTTPGLKVEIEFYSNDAVDPSGFGEGKTYLDTKFVRADAKGQAQVTITVPNATKNIAAIAIDKEFGNTSEFSFIDNDGDGIPDAWETTGIDLNEDGAIDYSFPVGDAADPAHRDVYVEVDAMAAKAGVLAIPANFANVITAFGAADVTNLDGNKGITLHAEIDDADLNRETWTKANAWTRFMVLKNGGGGQPPRWGTAAERAAANSVMLLKAKRLVYRYGMIANKITDAGMLSGWANLGGKGLPGNVFMVTLGAWAAPGGGGGDTLTVTDATQGQNGTVVVNADNTVTYTPNLDFTGTDAFTYTVSDGTGSAVANVTVTVSAAEPQRFAGVAIVAAAEVKPLTVLVLQPVFAEAVQRLTVATGDPATERLLRQTAVQSSFPLTHRRALKRIGRNPFCLFRMSGTAGARRISNESEDGSRLAVVPLTRTRRDPTRGRMQLERPAVGRPRGGGSSPLHGSEPAGSRSRAGELPG